MEEKRVNEEMKEIYDELIAKSNELLEKLNLTEVYTALENKDSIFYDKKITKIGSGSHILLPKAYEGRRATIIILNKKEEGKAK